MLENVSTLIQLVLPLSGPTNPPPGQLNDPFCGKSLFLVGDVFVSITVECNTLLARFVPFHRCSPLAKCEAPLPCGHLCQLMGHDSDVEHRASNQCQMSCNTTLLCGHVCASLCHEVDPGHKALYKCPVKCKGLRICGHTCRIKAPNHGCSMHARCLEKCGYQLECGHLCSLLCHHLVGDHMECLICANKPGNHPLLNGNKPAHDDHTNNSTSSLEPANSSSQDTSNNNCSGLDPGKCDDNCNRRLPAGPFEFTDSCILWSGNCSTLLPCGQTSCFKCCVDDVSQRRSPNDITIADDFKPRELAPKPARSPFTIINPGHKHTSDEECLKKCKSTLICGHKCMLQCNLHRQFPHASDHKCQQCTLSDTLLKELSIFKIPFSTPFDYCTHLAKAYNCGQICEGRRCEHPCGLAEIHKCSDHGKFNKVTCQIKCGMQMSCRHKCCKTCHVGDYEHKCRWMMKNNNTWCCKGPYADQVKNGQYLEGNAAGLEHNESSKHDEFHPLDLQNRSIGDDARNNFEAPFSSLLTISGEQNGLHPSLDCQGIPGDSQNSEGNSSVLERTTSDISCDHTCNKCPSCSATDNLREQFSSLQIYHPAGVSFNHCSHLMKMYECEQICPGRHCGHLCHLRKAHHTCLDHVALNKVSCREICGAELSCGRKCFRACHVGDSFHYCKPDTEEFRQPIEVDQRSNEGGLNPESNSCVGTTKAGKFSDPETPPSGHHDTDTEDSGVISTHEPSDAVEVSAKRVAPLGNFKIGGGCQ